MGWFKSAKSPVDDRLRSRKERAASKAIELTLRAAKNVAKKARLEKKRKPSPYTRIPRTSDFDGSSYTEADFK